MNDRGITDTDIVPTSFVDRSESTEIWPDLRHAVTRTGLRQAVQMREQITLFATESEDISVFPGERATAESLKRQRNLRRLRRLIERFATEGFSWSSKSISKITSDTAGAAQRFLDLFPSSAKLPKIAPDGDGGLTAVWDRNGNHDLLVLDGWTLHIVRNAATDHAEYDEDIPFDGQLLPESVKSLISA